MGHAYPFQARISIYSPDYSIIVATKGVSKDVRSHFLRVKPETEMNYVDKLDELNEMLKTLIFKIRSKRAFSILTKFDRIARIDLPLSIEIAKIFNIEANPEDLSF
jgi:hypothetical protein